MKMDRITATGMALLVAILLLFAVPTVGIGQSRERPALIFTGIADPDNLDNYRLGYRAVIFVFDRGAWRLINLPEQYRNAGWEYAGRAKGTSKVWAVAQFGHGDIGEDLEIAHSLNGGRTWRHLRSLKKISRLATFESFSMTNNGRGSLTVLLEENLDPNRRGGYYTYTTTNGGRTWGRNPRYSQVAPAPSNTSLEQIPVRAGASGIPCSEP